MGTATKPLPLLAAAPDGTNPPAVGYHNGRPYLAFDEDDDEIIVWTFRLPDDYASGGELAVQWSASAASAPAGTETVRWDARVFAVTPETDTIAMDTDGYDVSTNPQDDDALTTNAKRLAAVTLTLNNKDGMAAGDYVAIELRRDANHANDDLTEDAWLWQVDLKYTN